MRVFGRSKKLVMGAAVAAALAVAPMAPGLFSSAVAHAAAGDQLVFSGTANLSPPLPIVGNPTTSGYGYVFTQSSGATGCQYRQATGTPAQCDITVSNGTYDNIVCGTGTATGNATVKDHALGTTLWSGSFKITFAGGQGAMQATGSAGYGSGVGPTSIEATSAGDPTAGECVKAFQVTGAVSLTG